MRKVIASQWYRVDKSCGELLAVNHVNVLRAAQGYFNNPSEVIKTGRFQTDFAIYARGDMLMDDEKE